MDHGGGVRVEAVTTEAHFADCLAVRFAVFVRVELSAQDQAMDFYERLGYTPYGEGYLDEGIWHHDAFKDLS